MAKWLRREFAVPSGISQNLTTFCNFGNLKIQTQIFVNGILFTEFPIQQKTGTNTWVIVTSPKLVVMGPGPFHKGIPGIQTTNPNQQRTIR